MVAGSSFAGTQKGLQIPTVTVRDTLVQAQLRGTAPVWRYQSSSDLLPSGTYRPRLPAASQICRFTLHGLEPNDFLPFHTDSNSTCVVLRNAAPAWRIRTASYTRLPAH